jgi:hypothetical protein
MHYAGKEHEEAEDGRRDAQKKLKKAGQAVQALNAFYKEVSTGWSAPENRLLGHIVLSPPIRAGAGSSCQNEGDMPDNGQRLTPLRCDGKIAGQAREVHRRRVRVHIRQYSHYISDH